MSDRAQNKVTDMSKLQLLAPMTAPIIPSDKPRSRVEQSRMQTDNRYFSQELHRHSRKKHEPLLHELVLENGHSSSQSNTRFQSNSYNNKNNGAIKLQLGKTFSNTRWQPRNENNGFHQKSNYGDRQQNNTSNNNSAQKSNGNWNSRNSNNGQFTQNRSFSQTSNTQSTSKPQNGPSNSTFSKPNGQSNTNVKPGNTNNGSNSNNWRDKSNSQKPQFQGNNSRFDQRKALYLVNEEGDATEVHLPDGVEISDVNFVEQSDEQEQNVESENVENEEEGYQADSSENEHGV
jgi:hypothetical protein